MNDLASIFSQEICKHFIHTKNVRNAHERELDAKRMDELNGTAAEKNLFHSGRYLKQRSALKTRFPDALAYGYMEEAPATCKLYDVPLTRPLCASLEEAAKQMLTSFYRNYVRDDMRSQAVFRCTRHHSSWWALRGAMTGSAGFAGCVRRPGGRRVVGGGVGRSFGFGRSLCRRCCRLRRRGRRIGRG